MTLIPQHVSICPSKAIQHYPLYTLREEISRQPVDIDTDFDRITEIVEQTTKHKSAKHSLAAAYWQHQDTSSMNCFGSFKSRRKAKSQQKQQRAQERQKEQDFQRQKNPNGLLEIALEGGRFRRRSFTAADPGRFYKGNTHTDPWKAEEGVGGRDGPGFR